MCEERIKYKTCKCCGLEKSLEKFYRSSRNKNGRDDYCSVCRSAKAKESYYKKKRLNGWEPEERISTDTKVCKKCGEEQSIYDFYVMVRMKDQRSNVCKKCKKAVNNLSYKRSQERKKLEGDYSNYGCVEGGKRFGLPPLPKYLEKFYGKQERSKDD